jgi:hypothetical protein
MTRVGELVQTAKGWQVVAPSHCPNGHHFSPGRVLVGHQVCGGEDPGGHTTWTCLECDATVYVPEIGPVCEVLHGPAGVRG